MSVPVSTGFMGFMMNVSVERDQFWMAYSRSFRAPS